MSDTLSQVSHISELEDDELSSRKYYCDECGKGFARRFNLERHINSFHNTDTDDEDAGTEDESGDETDDDDDDMEKYNEMYTTVMNDIYSKHDDNLQSLYDEFVADGMDEDKAQETALEKSLHSMKKDLRNEIVKILTISYGMKNDALLTRLFKKVRKYKKLGLKSDDAIEMAVAKEKFVIDKDMAKFVQEKFEIQREEEE
mgnify:CR=1 FL=1